MTERTELDELFNPHDDFPTNPKEAAEQIARAAEWLAEMSRNHGLEELAALIDIAVSEANRQAKKLRVVN